jgi:hypothetical protein
VYIGPLPITYPLRGWWLVYVVVVSSICAVVMIGAGSWLLWQRQTGTRVEASVTQCRTHGAGRYERVHCDGTWIIGGSSLLDPGSSIVVGTVEGADTDDVGKTIDVTLSPDGQTAYTRDLRLPLILIGTGLAPAVGLVWWWFVSLSRRRRRAAGG